MPDPVEASPIKAECGSLCKVWERARDFVGMPSVGAPTMTNAAPNLNAAEADKMRDRAAEGTAPINVTGMDKTANAIKARQQALNAI